MEIFKDIFGGKYQISNFGRVKTFSTRGKGMIVKEQISVHGYPYYNFYIDGKQKTVKLHRLVADNFVLNPLNKPCINHINGIKTDNRCENLEWVTHSENTLHGYKIGTNRFSESQRKKYSNSMKGKTGLDSRHKKSVSDGINIFPTIKIAAEYHKINYKTLSAMLRGQNKNKTNLKFI